MVGVIRIRAVVLAIEDSITVIVTLAGITNTAFRRLCREFGGGLYVSEMVTSRALVEQTEGSLRIIGHHESEEGDLELQAP